MERASGAWNAPVVEYSSSQESNIVVKSMSKMACTPAAGTVNE
jgi:hypothetical protein